MNINKALLIVLSFGTITGTITCNEKKQTNSIESQFIDDKSNPFVIVKEEGEYTPQQDRYRASQAAYENFPYKLYCNDSHVEGVVYSKEELSNSTCKDVKYLLRFLDSCEKNKKLFEANKKILATQVELLEKENNIIAMETELISAKIKYINEGVELVKENKKLLQQTSTHHELKQSSAYYDTRTKDLMIGMIVGATTALGTITIIDSFFKNKRDK
jgi:hypothetical protein